MLPPEIIGRKILILGDIGSGKTRLTARIILELIRAGYADEITIIDMAPPRIKGAGGRLREYTGSNIKVKKYLEPVEVYAPRLQSRTTDEALRLAEKNREAIEPLIEEYLKSPTNILIINDLTIYLHAGSLEKILECVRRSNTMVANAYYGEKLSLNHGEVISIREKKLVEELIKYMDTVIRL